MNIEKESQKDIKANLISRKKFLLTIIAVLFSPSILIIRLLVLKIGKIENKRFFPLCDSHELPWGSLQLLIAFIVFISLVWRLKRTRYITIHINIKTTLTNIELPQKV